MKKRLTVAVVVLVLGLAAAGSAFAFDCIRVSSSLQGLKQATKSGNWLLFDFSSADALQHSLAQFDVELTSAQAKCVSDAYAKSGEPLYFALGIGVAGGRVIEGVGDQIAAGGVLAHNNPNDSVLGNGTGIDHLDDSGIFAALDEAATGCGIDVPED